MVAPEISLVLNTGAVLVLSVASVAVALLNATFGLGVGLTASLAINAIGLVTPLVTQGIQAVNQLLNTIPVTASMIPQALLPAIAGTVSTLETVVSGAVTNLICMSSSALSGVATAAQGALQQIMGELPSLTNALSGVLSTAGSSMTSGPITALQTALNSFQQMQANMTQMGK
jgi:phage-related protein